MNLGISFNFGMTWDLTFLIVGIALVFLITYLFRDTKQIKAIGKFCDNHFLALTGSLVVFLSFAVHAGYLLFAVLLSTAFTFVLWFSLLWCLKLRYLTNHKIDWDKAPSWAKYWVMQSNGSCFWLDGEPTLAFNKSYWNYYVRKSELAPTFGYEGDWQYSLISRS